MFILLDNLLFLTYSNPMNNTICIVPHPSPSSSTRSHHPSVSLPLSFPRDPITSTLSPPLPSPRPYCPLSLTRATVAINPSYRATIVVVDSSLPFSIS